MRRNNNGGIPAFLAISVLVLSELLRFFQIIPEQKWNEVEVICNAVMLLIAAIGFFVCGPFSTTGKPPVTYAAGNTAVSLMAIIMNIDIFNHPIRIEQLLPDLWGWHLFWIGFAVLQMMIFSQLGKLLLAQISGLLSWGKSIAIILGNTIADVLLFVKTRSSETILTVIIGVVLWVGWIVMRLSQKKTFVTLGDLGFWKENLLFWGEYLLITLLIRLLPAMHQITRGTLINLNGKKLLFIVGITTIFMVSILAESSPLGLFGIALTASGVTLSFLWRFFQTNGNGSSKPNMTTRSGIRKMDLLTLAFCFLWIPLIIIITRMLYSYAGRLPVLEMVSDSAAWLNFCNTAIDTANRVLQMCGIV